MKDLIALIEQYKAEGRSNAEIRSITELNYYNAKDYTEITEDGELIIADGITSIAQTFAHREYDSHGNLEFYPDNNKTIKRIKVPDSVKDIMHDAFASLHALEEVVLPEDLKYIGENAFANCEKLKKINIPSALTTIKSKTFAGCRKLENVVLQEGLETIEESAFLNCKNLKNVNFPESLQKEKDAFIGCKEELTSAIPSRLKMDENGVITNFFAEDLHDGVLTIPEGVQRITSLEGINRHSEAIEEIKLPDGLRIIDDGVIKYLSKFVRSINSLKYASLSHLLG